jgi:hypothetical protein
VPDPEDLEVDLHQFPFLERRYAFFLGLALSTRGFVGLLPMGHQFNARFMIAALEKCHLAAIAMLSNMIRGPWRNYWSESCHESIRITSAWGEGDSRQ